MSTTLTHVGVWIVGRCEAVCHTYVDQGPILAVDTPTTRLRFTSDDPSSVSTDELRFAYSLLAAVRTYVGELQERGGAEAEQTMVLPGTEPAALAGGGSP